MARFSTKCWNNCATCEYWAGPRTLHAPMPAAEVPQMATGACGRKNASQERAALTYATNSCTGWQEWGELVAARQLVPA